MSDITGILTTAANNNGIPPALLIAQAQQESSLNPNAYNASSGATGLLQLEPATAAQLGVTDALDPTQNAEGGASYLAQLYNEFGSWVAALAAYDWGPANVQKAQAAYGTNWLSQAPSETQNYVSSILSNSGIGTTAATITPDSISSGVSDTIEAFTQMIPAPSSGPSTGEILLLTIGGLLIFFVARDLVA